MRGTRPGPGRLPTRFWSPIVFSKTSVPWNILHLVSGHASHSPPPLSSRLCGLVSGSVAAGHCSNSQLALSS